VSSVTVASVQAFVFGLEVVLVKARKKWRSWWYQ